MKSSLFALLFILIAAFMPGNKKKLIIFFGDSITEAAVNPGGYIIKLDSILTVKGKHELYDLMGSGISGNKVYDLYVRMEDDVLRKEPDVVVIYIGVNDIWHKRTSGTGTDADKFENIYQAIIKKLKAKNIQVVLCTPAAIGEKTDFSNAQDGDLNEYSKIIRNLAQKNNLALVDLRKSFLEYGHKHNPENKFSGILTTDGVHLNAGGNRLVAEEMWKIIKAF